MENRDKYGNYVNNKEVTIKINTDKKVNDHISFYWGLVDKPHDAAHVNLNYDKGNWSATMHGSDKSDTSSSGGSCYLTTIVEEIDKESETEMLYDYIYHKIHWCI